MDDAERTDTGRTVYVEHKLDGNAAAGVLGEVFRFEVTIARTACAHCGATGSVGEQTAYVTGMGTVVRCAGCNGPLIRLAITPKGHWLDLRGVAYLLVES